MELETLKAFTQNSRRTLANQCLSPYTQIVICRNGCPFRLIHGCLLLVLQSLTQAYAVPYTAICRYADAYSKPSGLHGFLRCYSLSCTVVYFSSFQLMQLLISMRLYSLPPQQITQLLIQSPQTNNAVASSGLRSKLFKHLMY